MSEQTCAVIDNKGTIVNIIVADYAIDAIDGHTLVASSTAVIGGTYLDGVFTAPPAPPIPPAPSLTVEQQIILIEATITDRRIREAILSIDNGWLANLNVQINALRAKLSR